MQIAERIKISAYHDDPAKNEKHIEEGRNPVAYFFKINIE
jgi:hypothetical protein